MAKTNIVQDIRTRAQDQMRSVNWYRSQVVRLGGSKQKIRNDVQKEAKFVSRIVIGKMYLFRYDPKFKDILPVYDTYPLVFPFSTAPGGFLGINMHYLPYMFRIYLINRLTPYLMKTTKDGVSEVTKARMSWDILNRVAGVKKLDGAVKHYLLPHMRSRFMEISYHDWKIVATLPVENFVRNP